MKKIKLSAHWDKSENITYRLLKQFLTPDIDLSGVEFVYDDSYDMIIFFNYVSEDVNDGCESYVLPHEPSWIGTHQKVLPNGVKVLGFSKELYTGECIETTAHTFYGGRGPWIDSLDFWSYENLGEKQFIKSKNISSSITKLNTNNGVTCLYPQRFEIFKLTETLPFIDGYGGTSLSPKRQDALIDYRFNIAIENDFYKNWITEKFYDSVLTDTIPIYYGCKNIKEIYPEGGYLLIEDINDLTGIKNLLEHVNNNAEKIYSENIDSIRKIKKKYFEKYNLLKLIINL